MTTLSEDDLASLVAQARAGGRDALERIVAQLRPRIFRYVLARTVDPHAAEDVTQEVMVTMTQALPRYVEQGRPFTAWVFGIAANKLSESRRAVQRRREAPVAAVPDRTAEQSEQPEHVVVRLETAAQVARLLETLPARQAEILRLRVAAGLSAEETAAVLDMTPGAVRVAQHRALARLRDLAPRGVT